MWKGLRVSDTILDLLELEEVEWGKQYIFGYPMQFLTPPVQSRRRNYSTYTQQGDPSRQFYLNKDLALAGFWKGVVHDEHTYMDKHSQTSNGIPVITCVASGDQAGYFFGDRLKIKQFAPKDSAPHKSSNYRELATPLYALQDFGAELAGQRVLYRYDNSTTVSIINRQGTMSSTLLPLSDTI
jgi:hypothetical protein